MYEYNQNNTPIFTPDEFRAQAAELSQAVTELQRRDAQTIDPHDPFGNGTEFHGYQCDYGEIVPQIRIPGCRLPLKPNARERSRARRFQNIVGGFLVGHFVLSNIIAVVLLSAIYAGTTFFDKMSAGDLPFNYNTVLQDYVSGSSTMIALNLLCYGLMNVLVMYLGCRATKIPVSTLFRTKNFSVPQAVGYIAIALCIQMMTGHLSGWVTSLFDGVGVTLYEADFSTDTQLRSVVLSFIYGVIVAPITEELLMRGFVLKNLSRVSQRFGIVMSAFLFGIWHENVAQFVLAFAAGCFFGYITVKHDSLIPSIICHMGVNLAAELFGLCEDFGWEFPESLLDIAYTALAVIGLVLLVRMYFAERFPRSTPAQAERSLRITLTSPLMLLVMVCHCGAAVLYILQASEII